MGQREGQLGPHKPPRETPRAGTIFKSIKKSEYREILAKSSQTFFKEREEKNSLLWLPAFEASLPFKLVKVHFIGVAELRGLVSLWDTGGSEGGPVIKPNKLGCSI